MERQIFNGFDLHQINALIEVVKRQPQAGQSKLYAKVEWKSGFFTGASVKDFTAGGVTNTTSRSKPFIIPQDYPPELGGGTNKGASAAELLLATLGHCITGGFASSAALMGIPIESLITDVEGDIDIQGTLGLPTIGAVRPGFQEIRIKYYVKSTATIRELAKAMKMGEALSPVKDSLRAVRFFSQLISQ